MTYISPSADGITGQRSPSRSGVAHDTASRSRRPRPRPEPVIKTEPAAAAPAAEAMDWITPQPPGNTGDQGELALGLLTLMMLAATLPFLLGL